MPGGAAVDVAGRSSYSSLLAAAGLAYFKMAAVGSVELDIDGFVDEGEGEGVESGDGSDLGFLLR